MGERNDIQLAIGYGLGVGMAIAGVFVIVGTVLLSAVGLGAQIYVLALGLVVVLGGIAIAVLNALKLDREAVSEIKGSS